MMNDVHEDATQLACVECDREIERCEFCEERSCAHSICYRCVLYELGEASPVLHEHAGDAVTA